MTLDPHTTWQAALGELELQMTRATFDSLLRDTHVVGVSDDDHTLIVGVRNGYAVEWLTNRLYPVVERTIRHITGNGTAVQFVVFESTPPHPSNNPVAAHPDPGNGPDDLLTELSLLLRQVIDPATRRVIQERMAALSGVPVAEPEAPPEAFDTYDKGGGGWYPISNYADTFWKPLLAPCKAFLAYTTIRALDKSAREWTTLRHIPIQELQERIPCSRNTLLGETRGGVHRPGALEILRDAGIARIEARGEGKHTTYYVSVRAKLPMLTASQVRQLSDDLQAQHREFLLAHDLDPNLWE